MSRFSDFDQLVASFMQDFGFLATFNHITSTPNDATGGVDTVTVSTPVQAIKMELIRPTEGSGSKSGSLIQDGDQMLFVRPTNKTDPLAPSLVVDPAADNFIIAGEYWKIITCKKYEPDAADCILYEFYIRK